MGDWGCDWRPLVAWIPRLRDTLATGWRARARVYRLLTSPASRTHTHTQAQPPAIQVLTTPYRPSVRPSHRQELPLVHVWDMTRPMTP